MPFRPYLCRFQKPTQFLGATEKKVGDDKKQKPPGLHPQGVAGVAGVSVGEPPEPPVAAAIPKKAEREGEETEPPKGEEVVDAEIKSDDEDVVLVTDGETATPSAQETEEAAAQEPAEPSLPAWVREGTKWPDECCDFLGDLLQLSTCNARQALQLVLGVAEATPAGQDYKGGPRQALSSESTAPEGRHKFDLETVSSVPSMSPSVVIATFESDSAVWKSVGAFLAAGTAGLSSERRAVTRTLPELAFHFSLLEEGRSRRTGRRSRTPDVWEQERRRVIATQAGAELCEQRRKVAQEIERQKVQAAFEQRKKEAEEQRLREEEEWRARLVERRKKEAAEEEERLRREEEELLWKEEKDREKEKEKEREKERRSKQEAEEDRERKRQASMDAFEQARYGYASPASFVKLLTVLLSSFLAGFAMNQSMGMSKGAGKGKASHPKGYDHPTAKGQGGAGGYSSGGGNYGACGGGYGDHSEYSHGQDGYTGASSRGSNAGGKGGAAYAGCGGGYGDVGGGCGNGLALSLAKD
ncbi:Reticulocyte-binding protein 2-like a [Symbiodinium microadriaticum]|uniref:Reticulocyte-binding protein 2-like a n=1 Tax=Symbiodinium microadriaticum TaxID=2951 RepID=A0A1Q9C436_SYMMI|nr:Reticulocyte-binding protein 2-like a [Symbiodinium microadriaticum]